jgi:hypothetical protein
MARETIASPADRLFEAELSVRHWRRAQFRRLGFGPVDARRLADAAVDLAEARRLIAGGCPVSLALAILL